MADLLIPLALAFGLPPLTDGDTPGVIAVATGGVGSTLGGIGLVIILSSLIESMAARMRTSPLPWLVA